MYIYDGCGAAQKGLMCTRQVRQRGRADMPKLHSGKISNPPSDTDMRREGAECKARPMQECNSCGSREQAAGRRCFWHWNICGAPASQIHCILLHTWMMVIANALNASGISRGLIRHQSWCRRASSGASSEHLHCSSTMWSWVDKDGVYEACMVYCQTQPHHIER